MTNRPLARRANPSHPYIYRSKMMMDGGEFLVGTLSSLQNNPEGRASWIIAGLWKATMPSSKVNTTSATATSGNDTAKNTSVTSSGYLLMDDSAVSILLDPTKTKNHFDNTPIFGTFIRHVLVRL
jgi:hypothetical protein